MLALNLLQAEMNFIDAALESEKRLDDLLDQVRLAYIVRAYEVYGTSSQVMQKIGVAPQQIGMALQGQRRRLGIAKG